MIHIRTVVRASSPLLLAAAIAAGPGEARGQTLFALGETAALDFAGTMPGAAYHAPGSDVTFIHVAVEARELRVLRGDRVLHRFPVAVGKGYFFRPPDARHDGWHFSTPTGVFNVGRKEVDPVWYAPDWHFLEKGQAVPPADSPRRYFPGEMGDYAIYLGDGLAIHGTKYESSVGQAASHGCMRMSSVGIATIYPLVAVGTKVIITP
jgi:lipoprotein-anchoring transpeptidase ErfK/SrfK